MNASNSSHRLGRFRSWCARNLTVPMVFTLVFAAATVWSLWDGVRSEGARPSVAATPVSATVSNGTGHLTSQPLPSARVTGKFLTCPIRDLPVASWILAENPETEGNLGFDYSLFDPAELCVLKLRLAKPDGSVLYIDKLDFTEWLEEERLTVGSTTYLEYEELGISGDAEILSIAPCPRIPPRPTPRHCLVTSKFAHDAANVLDLYIEGMNEPIGVTANHPIWSEDRREIVRAGELVQGERVLQADHSTRHVLRATSRPGHVPVFNFEVDGEHVYFVSRAGVLVHNTYPRVVSYVPRPFPTQRTTGLRGKMLSEAPFQFFKECLRTGATPAMLRGQAQAAGYRRFGGWADPNDRLASKIAEAALQRAMRALRESF